MATRPSRLSPEIGPSFFSFHFLILSWNHSDFADTVSWSNKFQWLTTLSEKKWQRTAQLQRCLTTLNEWPRVLMSVFNSKNLVNGIGERFFAILKTLMRSERFLLSLRVHRFSWEDIISRTERRNALWLASWWNMSSVIGRYKYNKNHSFKY